VWGSLKDKVYKTNPPPSEELRNNIHCEISAISREEPQRVNTDSYSCRDTASQVWLAAYVAAVS
jgi:hypothetical protein